LALYSREALITLGVHIYAVGGNMQAARLTGIKVWLVLLFVYGITPR
jgi:ribose transport system permease protein